MSAIFNDVCEFSVIVYYSDNKQSVMVLKLLDKNIKSYLKLKINCFLTFRSFDVLAQMFFDAPFSKGARNENY